MHTSCWEGDEGGSGVCQTFANKGFHIAGVHGMLQNGKVIHHMYLKLNLLIFYGIGFYFY